MKTIFYILDTEEGIEFFRGTEKSQFDPFRYSVIHIFTKELDARNWWAENIG